MTTCEPRMPTEPTAPARPPRDPRATALLRELRAEALPPFVPGEPRNVAALHAAERAAAALLRMLARKHKVQRWDWVGFRTYFLEGMMASAKDGTVVEDDREVRLTCTSCPLLEEARRDPRACGFCQLLPYAAARLAVPDEVEEVRYDGLITQGAPACTLRMVRRPRPAPAAEGAGP